MTVKKISVPEDHIPSPAPLPEDELRETLDLLATAVASISDRVNKTATEARQAAFAARKQTDPETYGSMIGKPLTAGSAAVLTGLKALQRSADRCKAKAGGSQGG